MLASYLPTDGYNADQGQFSGDSVYNTTGLQAFLCSDIHFSQAIHTIL